MPYIDIIIVSLREMTVKARVIMTYKIQCDVDKCTAQKLIFGYNALQCTLLSSSEHVLLKDKVFLVCLFVCWVQHTYE